MSDETERIKIGSHHVDDSHHTHAYAAIAGMSEELRHQLFQHVENHNSAVFSAEVHGKMKEYRLEKDGSIHEHH